MLDLLDRVVGDRRVRIVASDRADGDLHPRRVDASTLRERQRALVGADVVSVEQVHGVAVHRVGSTPGWPLAGRADVVVAAGDERPIGIWAADCAPIVLVGVAGTIVGAHGGWRGLAAGVVDVAVAALTSLGDSVLTAVVGPVIHPCCYEFASDDLALVAAGVHAGAADVTAARPDGRLALDVPAAVRSALGAHGVALDGVGPCTGCDDRWFSHRVRADTGRHAVIAFGARLDG